jgi:hypothetical protein
MKLKEFEKHLTKNGCMLLREGGNHSIWGQQGKFEAISRCKA